MSDWTIWGILAAAMLVAEMMTGTFYLMVTAVAAAAGALTAYAGVASDLQIGIAAMVAALGFVALQKFRPPTTRAAADANPDVNPDIGQAVRVSSIEPDGSVRVQYRGAMWAARVDGGAPQMQTDYVIVRVEGSILILALKT